MQNFKERTEMAEKNSTKKNNSNSINTNTILVAALIIAAFFIGSLWSRLQNLENQAPTVGGPEGVEPTVSILTKIPELARAAGADEADFATCYDKKETAAAVQADVSSGTSANITGTPGNILLNTETGEGYLLSGAVGVEVIKTYVNGLLNGELIEDNPNIAYSQNYPVEEVTSEDWVKGNPEAKIALIEYSDYECPYCQRFHPTAEQAVKDFNGDLKWVYRHFPLDQIHPNARTLAIAAECVGRSGGNDAFWKFTDAVYSN